MTASPAMTVIAQTKNSLSLAEMPNVAPATSPSGLRPNKSKQPTPTKKTLASIGMSKKSQISLAPDGIAYTGSQTGGGLVATAFVQSACQDAQVSKEEVLAELDAVIDNTDPGPAVHAVRLAAGIFRLAPQESTYHQQARKISDGNAIDAYKVQRLEAVAHALRADIEAGYVQTIEQRTRGEIFDDLLEMASAVVKTNPAGAAILAGAVLEEHIRKMAAVVGIRASKANGEMVKFENLSQSLVKEGVISQPERKIIAGWYGQRTEATHGRFENVVDGEVPRMIESVRRLLVDYPA